MSRCENSQISAQDTVGVAGDEITYHIEVWDMFLLFYFNEM